MISRWGYENYGTAEVVYNLMLRIKRFDNKAEVKYPSNDSMDIYFNAASISKYDNMFNRFEVVKEMAELCPGKDFSTVNQLRACSDCCLRALWTKNDETSTTDPARVIVQVPTG